MDENGFYCGWRDYKATIMADLLSGFTVTVTGRNGCRADRYDAEYFEEVIAAALQADFAEPSAEDKPGAE